MPKLRLELDELEVVTFQTAKEGSLVMVEGPAALWTNTTDNCISRSDVRLCLGRC